MDGHGQARTNTDGMVREYAISQDPPPGRDDGKPAFSARKTPNTRKRRDLFLFRVFRVFRGVDFSDFPQSMNKEAGCHVPEMQRLRARK